MKKSGIVLPIKTSLINPSSYDEGGYSLKNVNRDIVVDVVREGTELNKANSVLNIRMESENVSGNHMIRNKPQQNGLMVRNFSEPFKFMYSFEDNITKDNWLGQSELGCREYRAFGLTSASAGSGTLSNVRIFEYNGSMYMVCESYNFHLGKYSRFVSLHKYQDYNTSFNLVYRFSNAIVDENDFSPNAQEGSPDFVIVDGELLIIFRIANYTENINQIIVNKPLNEDLTEWQELSRVNVEKSPTTNLKSFRLRACYGNGAIMVVYYGTSSRTGAVLEDQDMRSYVSFDGGYNFETKNKDYNNIIINDNGKLERPNSTNNMAFMFVPKFPAGALIGTYTGFNTKFSLYFDESMSSFVILKVGDLTSVGNRRRLIGIKTESGSFSTWEPCLNYHLNVQANGDVKTKTNWYDFDAYDETLSDSNFNNYTIDEVEVLSGETNNILFMVVRNVQNKNGLVTNYTGTVFSEFRFVSNNLIESGLYDTVFAYGGKYHPDYSFVTTVINRDCNGIVCTGNNSKPTTSNVSYNSISACYYKGRVAVTLKQALNTNELICFMKNYSNVGERVPYQHNYCRYLKNITDYDWVLNNITGSVVYDEAKRGHYFTLTNIAGYSYYAIGNSAGMTNSPNVMQRASLATVPIYKIRFEAGFEGIPIGGSVMFLNSATQNHFTGQGFSLRLSVDGDGLVTASNHAGVNYGLVATLDLTKTYEFMTGIGYYRDNSLRGFVWYRISGEMNWTYGSIFNVSLHATPSAYCRLGIVLSSSTLIHVLIGNIMISSYENGYRNSFSRDKKNRGSFSDGPLMFAFGTPSNDVYPYESGTVDCYTEKATLHDGSIISFSGTGISNDSGSTWRYEKTTSLNSLSCIQSNIADYGIDLTRLHSEAEPLEIFFKNEFLEDFDSFSLINISGIYEVDLKIGEYDADTDFWISEDLVTFSIPFIVLELEAYSSKRWVVSEQEFIHNNLTNFTISLYNTSTNQTVDVISVIQNYYNVIEVSKAISDFTDIQIRLHFPIATFAIPDNILNGTKKNMSIKIKSLDIAELIYLGEIVFGKFKDLSYFTNEASHSTTSNNKIITSSENYMYYSIKDNSNNTENIELSFRLLSSYYGDYLEMEGIVNKIYKDRVPILLLFSESDNSLLSYYCSPDSKPDFSNNGIFRDIKLNLVSQSFRPRSTARGFNSTPNLFIEVSNSEPYLSESITFTATATDEDGDSLTYLWDTGDGFTSTMSSFSHSFSNYGQYNVSCTVTDSYGNSVKKNLNVFVNLSNISYYFISSTGGATKPLSTNITVTIIGRDSNNNNVIDDSSTALLILAQAPNPANFFIDLDMDGIFNESPDDVVKRLVAGSLQFVCKSTSAQTVPIYIYDSSGRTTSVVLIFS